MVSETRILEDRDNRNGQIGEQDRGMPRTQPPTEEYEEAGKPDGRVVRLVGMGRYET